jgi:hypothetical protein
MVDVLVMHAGVVLWKELAKIRTLEVKLRQLIQGFQGSLADNTILLMPNILLVGFAESGRDYIP